MNQPRVLSIFPMMHPIGDRLLDGVVEVVIPKSAAPDDIVDAGDGAAGLLVRSPAFIDGAVMDALSDVAVISAIGSGADCVDVVAASQRGIPLLHNPGVAPDAVAEYVIGSILVLLRRLREADAFLRAGGAWEPKSRFMGSDAAGRTLGIVGFGHIGRAVARRARLGLDMQVVVYSPSTSAEVAAANGVQLAELDELLTAADVVSLHVPLRPTTRHLLGSREFALMKPTALLVNTARGPVVDEGALLAALRSGEIAGAALDVFDPEPPQPDNPLFELPNVLVTPHIGGSTTEAIARLTASMVTNLLRGLRGERPEHILNPDAWPPRRLLPNFGD